MPADEDLTIKPATNADCERVRQLVFGVLREYGLEPDPDGTDKDISDIEGNYLSSGGTFEVIEDAEGRLLGTVGLYPLTDETVELRKMYFVPRLRGRGWGKKILSRMIAEARRRGYSKIFLETSSVLSEAIRLYEGFGFRRTGGTHTPRSDRAYVLDL